MAKKVSSHLELGSKSASVLALQLDQHLNDLRRIEPSYSTFSIPKRLGGSREITAPNPKLKDAQERILRQILSKRKSHPAAMAYERNRSIVDNAGAHTKQAVVVKMDIVDFFPSTKAERVWEYFRLMEWDSEAVEILIRLCTFNDGLPQGAPTSPRLSNLVNYILDARLNGLAQKLEGIYTRYADDLTFSFAKDDPHLIHGLIRSTKNVLADYGYQLHGKKKLHIRRRHDRQVVTGLVVNERVNLPRQTRRWLRAVEHHLDTGREATISPTQFAGWHAFRDMINYQASKYPNTSADPLISRLFNEKFRIRKDALYRLYQRRKIDHNLDDTLRQTFSTRIEDLDRVIDLNRHYVVRKEIRDWLETLLPIDQLISRLFSEKFQIRRDALYILYEHRRIDHNLDDTLRQTFSTRIEDLDRVIDLNRPYVVRKEIRDWLETLLPKSAIESTEYKFSEIYSSLKLGMNARPSRKRLETLNQLTKEITNQEWSNIQKVKLIELVWEAFNTDVDYPFKEVRRRALKDFTQLSADPETFDLIREALEKRKDLHQQILIALDADLPNDVWLRDMASNVNLVPPEEPAIPAPLKVTEDPDAVIGEPFTGDNPDPDTLVIRKFIHNSIIQSSYRELHDYHTIDIHLTPSKSDQEDRITNSDGRELSRKYTTILKWLTEKEGKPQVQYFERPLKLDTKGVPSSKKGGVTLFDSIFHNDKLEERDNVRYPGEDLNDGFRRALDRSQTADKELHIQIRIDNQATELHHLKWEYLWDPKKGEVSGALACDVRTPFTRVLHVSSGGDNRPTFDKDTKLRVLAAMTSPKNLNDPDDDDLRNLMPIDQTELITLRNGLEKIEAMTEPLEGDNLMLERVSLHSLRKQLIKARDQDQRPVHVLHLLCHGITRSADGMAYLVLHARDSEIAELVPESSFANVLEQFRPNLRLVVLASCMTAQPALEQPLQGVARRLVAAGFPAVVAMQGLLEFTSAHLFSERLYAQLANHGTIDLAVNAGRRELYDQRKEYFNDQRPGRVGPNQWGLPVLFMSIPDGRLFDVDEGVARSGDPNAEIQALSYDQAPGSDLTGKTEELLRSATIQLHTQYNLPAPPPPQVIQQALEVAEGQRRKSQNIFTGEGQEELRWDLLRLALEHRRHPARRTVLFLRELARDRIARLVEPVNINDLTASIYQEQIWDRGVARLGKRNAWDIVEGGPTGEQLSTRSGNPIEGNSSIWRTGQRGFESLNGEKIPNSQLVHISGNLTWSKTGRTTLAADRKPQTEDLYRLLHGKGDTFSTFHELTSDPARMEMGFDERTASLLLHAIHPDQYVPYHKELADKVLNILQLERHSRYDDRYLGYCRLASELLADDDLGFDNLADVGYFLMRLADGKLSLKEDASHSPDLKTRLEKVDLTHEDIDTGLVLRSGVIEQSVTALNAGQHIILIGPPGTGKTSLAEDLCRYAHDQNFNRGHVLVTATADWTTFDTIGGYMPDDMPGSGGSLVFRPGIFLEAIEDQKWLVIDEINRADIDKAFGELFTVLSDQAVTLPYRQNDRQVRILPPDNTTSRETSDYAINPGWRIIGTMNVYDKASLFAMSYAFMRRFAFIDVGVPRNKAFNNLIRYFLQSNGMLVEEHTILRELIDIFRYTKEADVEETSGIEENYLMRWRTLGPAIALDVVGYLRHRTHGKVDELTMGHLAEVLLLYVVPQFDGLEQHQILQIHGQLKNRFPTGEDPIKHLTQTEHIALLGRIEELFPFVPDEAWLQSGKGAAHE